VEPAPKSLHRKRSGVNDSTFAAAVLSAATRAPYQLCGRRAANCRLRCMMGVVGHRAQVRAAPAWPEEGARKAPRQQRGASVLIAAGKPPKSNTHRPVHPLRIGGVL
jgi:hypothetical protein